MQAAAITSRFLTGRSSKPGFADSESVVGNDDLLRDIVAGHLIQAVNSQELFLKLSSALIQFAEHAYVRRNMNALEDVSRVLMNLPVDAARQVGLYYQALVVKRKGDLDAAQMLLETVADNAPLNYRARAIQGLGANYHDKRQLNEALRFQVEALRIASGKNAHGLQTMLMAHFEITIVRSLAGDHNGALSQFEKLWPIVNFIARQNPYYFYYFHNELAVELGELGRLEEAEAACKIALASPFASAYPEWAETRAELEAKRTSATPSVVAVKRPSEVVPTPRMRPQPCRKPNRVVAFGWLGSRGTFHRTVAAIVRFIPIANHPTDCYTLDQLGRCIRSRAPPA